MKQKPLNYQIQNRSRRSAKIIAARENLYRLFSDRPMTDEELLTNLALYMRSSVLAKILFLDELYRKIVPLPGVIMEFGVWWGQSLALFENFRAIYEPYNFLRKVVGFDTFKGYQGISAKDIKSQTIKGGGYAVSDDYQSYLSALLQYHEDENTMSQIKKSELVKGNAEKTIKPYLARHPETIIALAYFDMALYRPTKMCLEAITPHLVKGSIIAMDEINNPAYPGETTALREVWGLKQYTIKRSQYLPDRSYLIID